MKALTIGRLARLAGVGTETVRYYERVKLMPCPARHSPRGYRVYPEEAVARLQFIRKAQECGFKLSEIADILKWRNATHPLCGNIRALVKLKIAEMEKELKRVARRKRILSRAIAGCRGTCAPKRCSILKMLARGCA